MNLFLRWWRLLHALGIAATELLHAHRDFLRPDAPVRHAALTSPEKRRLQHYQYGVAYLCAVFAALRGRGRTTAERRRCIQMAALAAFFDDLSESSRTGTGRWHQPESYGRAHDGRGLALLWLREVENSLKPEATTSFREAIERVFELETQTAQNADPETLRLHADAKGACSVLAFRHLLVPCPTLAEANALRAFGALIQYCDDIFDVWFDRQKGHTTYAWYCLEHFGAEFLERDFETAVAATRDAFLKIRDANGRLGWAAVRLVVAVTRVCLQRYVQLSKKHGTLPLADRSQMVVDMERWNNRLHTAALLLFGNE